VLAIEVDTNLPAERVIRVLERIALHVAYRKNKRGSQEAVFSPDEIKKLKKERPSLFNRANLGKEYKNG